MQKAGLLLVKIWVWIASLVPFRALHRLAGALAFVFSNLVKYRREVVRSNLRRSFPEKPPAEIKRLARRFYRHFADVLLESAKGLTLPKAQLQRRFRYRNPEVFDPLFEKNQSAILLGSHVGNWEWGVLSFPLAVRHRVVGIYKPLRNRLADAWLNRLRKRWGLHLASVKQAGRAVVENRNHPCIFVLIADQSPPNAKTARWLTFLHQDTPFLQGAERLARQTGYPVFVFDIERVGRGFYEVNFTELCSRPQEAAEGEITALFASHLEKTIRRQPESWLWSHRRWKRKRPA